MAVPERSFGPPLGGPAVYLDTSHSDIVDATDGSSSLFISGNTSGVAEFQDYFDLGGTSNSIDLSTASSSEILSAIEEALESRDSATGLTGFFYPSCGRRSE